MKLTAQLIENWVARNFPNYKRRSNGRQLNINNPFDGDDDRHFWISLEECGTKKHPNRKDFWVHDFRHSKNDSSFIAFVAKYRNCSRYEALKDICGDGQTLQSLLQASRSRLQDHDEEEPAQQELELPPMSRPFSDISLPKVRNMATNYLHGRCVSDAMIEKHLLYYTPTTIVFPYIEYGSIVYWQEREIVDKRFNFPDAAVVGVEKTDFLYNFDNVEPCDYVVIVESIFNCLSLGDNCVASGGAILAGRQLQKLHALNPDLIVLAPDNDKAGIGSLAKNYFFLHKEFKLAYCLPPGDDDWNDMDKVKGPGTARNYVDNHIYNLNLSTVLKLTGKVA